MARDAGTKTDKPTEQEGKGTPAKEELETQQAAQQAAQDEAAAKAEAPKPKAAKRRKPAAKKAGGTAAEATGVDKEAAEAGLEEGTDEAPAKPARKRKPAAKKRADAGAGAKRADAGATPKGDAKDAPKSAPKAAKAPAEGTVERPQRRAARRPAERVTVRAHARYVRTSARKARLVADHVRGRTVGEARAILAFHPRSVAEDWRKLLNSAVANAEHNHDFAGDDLRIVAAIADEGPTLKRFRPRAQGRATRIRKRTSHLTITLTPKES